MNTVQGLIVTFVNESFDISGFSVKDKALSALLLQERFYPTEESAKAPFDAKKLQTKVVSRQVLCTGGGQARPESGFVRQRYAGD